MIDAELVAKIRLLFFAEHWKIGTIATQLNLHRDAVRAALETDRFNRPKQDRAARKTDPYVEFIRKTLAQYPRLRSTRIFQMMRARGYEGGSSQLRRLVAQLRPRVQEPFLQLRTSSLYQRGFSFDLVRSALLLATARRLAHDPAHPLPPVRSLHYFLPVLDEINSQPLPPGYLQYLEAKLCSAQPQPAPQPTDPQQTGARSKNRVS